MNKAHQYFQIKSEQTSLEAGGGKLHRISCVTFSLIKKRVTVRGDALKGNFVMKLQQTNYPTCILFSFK